jgi:iron complex outermembrane recepter protein
MPGSMNFHSVAIALICAVSLSARASADTPNRVDVASGELATALENLAKQSGVEFIYSADQMKGIRTAGVHGDYTIEQAVGKLLEGTQLRITLHTASAILIAVPTSNATGQTPSTTADAQPSRKEPGTKNGLEEIAVTGSRLRMAEAAIASPLIVITQDDMKEMGFSTAEDVIRSLSQNYSSVNAATVMDLSQFAVDAQGQSAVNLRGLGADSTLVLVNGRRRAVSATFGDVVNLNTIPIGSIDRIEIMTDGASAVYGSDAVAGVINFILKKDYQGGETHIRQVIGANGGDSASLEQSLGDSWNSGNITFSGRFAKTDPVTSLRTGDTTSNFTRLGGDDWRDPGYGQPGVVTDLAGNNLGSLPAGNNGTNGIAGKLSPANVVPYDPAAYDYDAVAGTKDYSFDINVEQNMGSGVRAYGEFSLSRNTSEAVMGPSSAAGSTYPMLAYGPVVATGNRYNNLGVPVEVNYIFGNEVREGLMPPQINVSDQRAMEGVLGFKLNLPHDWTVDISVDHSQESVYFNSLAINDDIVAARASGVDANGSPVPAPQQLNLFGNGTAQNPAALAGLMQWNAPYDYFDDLSTSDSGLITAEGVLTTLTGGDMHLNMGGEFRREELNYKSDTFHASMYDTPTPSRTVKAAFAELNVPLVGDHNRIPGMYWLNLYAAGRWEQYEVSGPFDGAGAPDRQVDLNHVSPKLGISWYPWEELKLRGTVSNSFEAPNLLDLFTYLDGPEFGVPIVNPALPAGQRVTYPVIYSGGNPNLAPETARNFTTGLDWKPTGRLQGLAMALTYSRIDFDNLITSSYNFIDYPAVLFALPGVVQRNAGGQIVRVNLIPVNVSSERGENADVSAAYRMDSPIGQLTFGISGTYAIELEESEAPGLPSISVAGTENGPPRVKARSWVGWSRRDYGLNLYANYSSSYTNDNKSSPSSLPPQSVHHYTTFDLNGFYNLAGGFSINAGARNLTNAAFPFFNYYVPYDMHVVDLRGRILYLEISSKYKL